VGPDGLHTLINVLEEVVVRPKPDLAPLERSDLETEIAERLEEIGMPEAWDVAASLADSGIQTADIHRIVMACSCDGLAAGLRWISEALVLSDLSAEIEDAASRIAELVATVKDYSSMDQAPSQEVDVRQGLISTLKILGHKIREKNIQVVKEFDPAVPSIVAIPGELNQVWTNLIANAIDAMSPGGTLSLRTAPEGPCILVEIGDTGTGIPDEIRNRIFDPFFTTKPVGQGTGLGLDVAYKIVVDHHGGSLRFRSRPGETVFEVRLPPGP
jgi:signal transduction histidine kinase